MPIIYDEQNKIFNLQTPNTSYVIGLFKGKVPIHIHYGNRIERTYKIEDMYDKTFSEVGLTIHNGDDFDVMDEVMPEEFPVYGSGYFGTPAFHAQYEDGSSVSRLYYSGHKIYEGKPQLKGLPSAYTDSDSEAQTLELYLQDELTGVKIVMCYTAYNDRDVITRSHKVINGGSGNVRLKNIMSGFLSMPDKEYDFISLEGDWCHEGNVQRIPLIKGSCCVDSKRGTSSHTHNPFVCLASKGATEEYGSVYAMNLVYSGNFVSGVFTDRYNSARLYTGINPFDFEWLLESGEEFQTPECVMVYSDEGLGKMSHIFHDLVRERICRGTYRGKERPVLINNWEGTYFDFDEEKIVNIAKQASELGIDLMVLDDGWFGKRNDDTTSLGDWFVNRDKLPCGIDGLAEHINKLGMKFGLWFEPEMVSPESELYKKHPDWCMHVNGRTRSLGRQQLVLDLSRDDVCEYIIGFLTENLTNANIEYIKWDMNRYFSEIGSALLPPERQRETAHRYVLGLYKILDTIKTQFPNVLLEGCASGGGRFDLGMFCYFDQFWTSDDSEAIERLYIQTGMSYAYPTSVMGAHVSAVPNHQLGRSAQLNTRGLAAMPGQFGYELDITKMPQDEKAQVKEQVALYKEISRIFHSGDMYRIISPFDKNVTVWEFVSKDKSKAIAQIFTIKAEPNSDYRFDVIRFKGLDENAMYKDSLTGKVYSGEALMNIGIKRARKRDFEAEMLVLEKIN